MTQEVQEDLKMVWLLTHPVKLTKKEIRKKCLIEDLVVIDKKHQADIDPMAVAYVDDVKWEDGEPVKTRGSRKTVDDKE